MNKIRLVISLVLFGMLACGQPSERLGPQSISPTISDRDEASPDNSSSVTKGVQPSAIAVTPSPLVTEGKLKTTLPEYRVPEKVRERISKFQPDLLPPPSLEFQVADQHLTIDAKQKKVTSGTLKVTGRSDESFELACGIDIQAVPWVCTDMIPTNEDLAAQKRFQGTFKCLDTYQCDKVGVKLWVVIDGKLQEPQLFQAEGFQIREAEAEDEEFDTSLAKIPELPPKSQDRIKPEDDNQVSPPAPLPGPNPIAPVPPVDTRPKGPAIDRPPVQTPAPRPPLTAKELDDLLDNPDSTLEIAEPISMPNPTLGKYSVPGIEKLPALVSGKIRVQAVGWHNSGHLQKATEMPAKGPGFISRDHGKKDYGTDVMINLITDAMAVVEKKFPSRPPVVIGSIANLTGGRLLNLSGNAHASHQTGLDADIGVPSNRPVKGLWQVCLGECRVGAKMSEQLDEERFWNFLETISCAENKPVMAMFLDRSIKKDLCRYVRQTTHEDLSDAKSCAYQTLQRIHHWPGHKDHVHVRLVCPEKSACQNTWVTLDNATGC